MSERAMLHDMSKEFWHAMDWVFLISAIVVPITGWYLAFGAFFVFAAFLRCFMGAVYMVQLGNASEPRKDRPE
jgi:1,4-dihydroxy-2-naphthoate octaprenyltransferase